MNWRRLWQATIANVRAIFGITPSAPPVKPHAPRLPRALSGPTEAANGPRLLLPPPSQEAYVIDLTRAPVDPPQAPLRRRPNIRPIGDTTVDAAPARSLRATTFSQTDDEVVVVQDSDRLDGGMDMQMRTPPRAQAAPFFHHSGNDRDRVLPQVGLLPGPSLDAKARAEGAASLPEAAGAFESEYGDESAGSPADDGSVPTPGDGDATGKGDLALSALLESLLFVAAEPVDPDHLAHSLELSPAQIEQGLVQLAADLQQMQRGLRLQRFKGHVQLVTAPAAAAYIEGFLNLDTSSKLSGPALEALAVIAYRQPVTRAQIEAVRGVDCAGVLRSLVQRGLVAEHGRLESVGRPILYGVTELFMQHFGLVEMDQLPPLEETEADRLWAATVLAEEGLGAGNTGGGPEQVEGQ